MSLLGIDVGTTGCKAVAFNPEGKVLAIAYREYPLHSPQPGWAELDSAQVWMDVQDCIREVAKQTKDDPISALAVSAQGEAVTPVDEDGNILSNSIVSFCSRTEPYVKTWADKFGRKAVFEASGQPLASLFTALKLQWMKDNQADVLSKTKYILGFEDLVNFKLTGEAVTDYSLASRTMVFDLNTKDWNQGFLDFIGIEREKMPEAKPSGTLIGTVQDYIAGELGLPRGVAVVTGGHDQPCQMLGAGVTEPNVAAYGIGTVECIGPAFPNLLLNDTMLENNICCYYHTCPDLFIALVYNFTGGSLLRWYRDTFAQDEMRRAQEMGKDVYDILTSEASDQPSNILVLPHFTTSGVPHFDTRARGVFAGMRLGTTKGEMTRAVLEGITYEMRLCVELFQQAGGTIEVLRATGGGAKSPYWLQLKSDLIGIPIAVPSVAEAGCLGCAILAGSATGVYPSIKDAAERLATIDKTYYPDNKFHEAYTERFECYKELYPSLKETLHKLP